MMSDSLWKCCGMPRWNFHFIIKKNKTRDAVEKNKQIVFICTTLPPASVLCHVLEAAVLSNVVSPCCRWFPLSTASFYSGKGCFAKLCQYKRKQFLCCLSGFARIEEAEASGLVMKYIVPIFHKHAFGLHGVNLGMSETQVMERARLTQFVEFMRFPLQAFVHGMLKSF